MRGRSDISQQNFCFKRLNRGTFILQLQSEKKISEKKYSEGIEISRTSKDFLLDIASSCDRGRALDIGCGTGINASKLDSLGFKVSGVDLSETAIKKFKEQGYDGLVYDVSSDIPFDDNTFELVFVSEVIEHLDDVSSFLIEIKRVLKPQGCLVLSTPNSVFWAYRLLTLLGKSPSEVQHPGHLRFFSPRLLKKLLKESGLSEIEMSARNMYFIVGEALPAFLIRFLQIIPFFQQETRFLTKNIFFHISKKSKNVSAFWSDTILVKAYKK